MVRSVLSGVISLSIVLFFSLDCNKKMSDREFVDLYIKIAKATEDNLAQPDKIPLVHEQIFKESGYTRQAFEEFEKKYRDQPEKWMEIWKAIEKKSPVPGPPPQ